jgi:hypothetical protein
VSGFRLDPIVYVDSVIRASSYKYGGTWFESRQSRDTYCFRFILLLFTSPEKYQSGLKYATTTYYPNPLKFSKLHHPPVPFEAK